MRTTPKDPTSQAFDQLLKAETADEILSALARYVWTADAKRKGDPPDITPEEFRQWIEQQELTVDFLQDFRGDTDIEVDLETKLRQMPKDPEPDNWQMRMWYRIRRCQLQHEIDIPALLAPIKDLHGLSNFFFKHIAELQENMDVENLVEGMLVNFEEIKPRNGMNIAVFAILDSWNDYPPYLSSKDVYGISSLEDGIVAMHNLWDIVNKKHNGEFRHPIESIVKMWIQEKTARRITPEYDRKYPVSIMDPASMGSIRNMVVESPCILSREDIGVVKGISAPAPETSQIELPGLEKQSILPAVLPLQTISMVEGLGLETTKRGAVSMPIRLFFEAVMALAPNETQTVLHFRLGDLLQYLNPGGKYNRTNHLPHVLQGLRSLYFLRIPYRENPKKPSTEVDWIPVLPRTVPNLQSGNDAPIILEVKLPPDAKGGMMVEKDILRLTGKYSSARFNAYLTACWLFDKYGTNPKGIIDPTKPVERRDDKGYLLTATDERILDNNGRPIKNLYHKAAVASLDRVDNEARKRYPVIRFEELTRACFPKGFDSKQTAKYRKRALKAWNVLADEGILRIEEFEYGWRIMPSESHIGRYRAVKKQVY